jgi:hypothetical protein
MSLCRHRDNLKNPVSRIVSQEKREGLSASLIIFCMLNPWQNETFVDCYAIIPEWKGSNFINFVTVQHLIHD